MRGGVGRDAGEEGLCEPAREERLGTDLLDLVGESIVGGATCLTLVHIGEAGRRADEHESGDELGVVHGEPQREASSHRVPDVDAAAPGPAERSGGRDEVAPHSDVDSAGLEALGQGCPHRVPRLVRLGEAGYEHDAHACILASGDRRAR